MITMKYNTPEGIYNLAFRVSDHRHSQNNVSATVTVTVKQIPFDAVISCGSLRISHLSGEDFIKEWNHKESKVQQLKHALSEVLDTEKKNIDIFSVKQHRRKAIPLLDIFFSIKDSRYENPEKINGLLQIHKAEIERTVDLNLVMAGIHYCFIDKIKCRGPCIDIYSTNSQTILVDANMTSLVGISLNITPECNSSVQNIIMIDRCHENHCYNGGHCIQKGKSIRCSCPNGYEGPRCQQMVISFQGGGWAWFQAIHPQAENHVSLEFLTKKDNGLLFYNGPISSVITDEVIMSDYIALELQDGRPRLLFHVGYSTTELVIKVKKKLNDGEWHQIDVFWNSEYVHLLLDYCKSADVMETRNMTTSFFNGTSCQVKGKVPLYGGHLSLNSPLQIGGIYWGENSQETFKWNACPNAVGFEGCIRNLYSNGQILDLSDVLLSVGTATGCSHTKRACSSLDCSGHGTCQADLTDREPWCLCDAGWRDPSCSSPTLPVTFLPHSYVKFALSFEIGHFTTFIQLRFRTEEKDGELFGLSDQQSLEYAILEIQQGYLYFRYNLNSKRVEEKSICLCYISVDDGHWHIAKVSRYGSLAILQLDDGEFLRRNQTSFFEGHQWLIIDKQEGAHAGGRAENTGINTVEVYSDYRNGCVDDIRLNGRILPLPPAANITQWGQATVALNLEFGCSFSSDCSFSICTEPAKCRDTFKQHKCVCSDAQVLAATSKDCIENDCSSNFCGNPENCLNLQSKFYYDCQCPDGITTMNCKFLGDKDTFGVGVWALIILLSTVFLILVLAGIIVIYKYHCNTDQKKHRIKNDIRENVIQYADEGIGEDDMTLSNVKPLMIPVNESEIVVSFELDNLQDNRQSTIRSIINKYKDKTDAEIQLKNNDDIHIYFCEGSRSSSSSLSSICTGYEGREQALMYVIQMGLIKSEQEMRSTQ